MGMFFWSTGYLQPQLHLVQMVGLLAPLKSDSGKKLSSWYCLTKVPFKMKSHYCIFTGQYLKFYSEGSLHNDIEWKWLGIKFTVWAWIFCTFVEFQTHCTEHSVKNSGLDCFALSMICFPKETGRNVLFIWQAIPDNWDDHFPWHTISLYRIECKCQYWLKSIRYS